MKKGKTLGVFALCNKVNNHLFCEHDDNDDHYQPYHNNRYHNNAFVNNNDNNNGNDLKTSKGEVWFAPLWSVVVSWDRDWLFFGVRQNTQDGIVSIWENLSRQQQRNKKKKTTIISQRTTKQQTLCNNAKNYNDNGDQQQQ